MYWRLQAVVATVDCMHVVLLQADAHWMFAGVVWLHVAVGCMHVALLLGKCTAAAAA